MTIYAAAKGHRQTKRKTGDWFALSCILSFSPRIYEVWARPINAPSVCSSLSRIPSLPSIVQLKCCTRNCRNDQPKRRTRTRRWKSQLQLQSRQSRRRIQIEMQFQRRDRLELAPTAQGIQIAVLPHQQQQHVVGSWCCCCSCSCNTCCTHAQGEKMTWAVQCIATVLFTICFTILSIELSIN